MKPSFIVYQEDKGYKKLHTEKFFIDLQGEFYELSCHSPLCMHEKIYLFLMLNVGNVTMKKICLGHKNYSLTNIHNFFTEILKFRFLSHCGIWGLHSIVHKHQGPFGYGETTWHHTQKIEIFSVITQNKLFYKTKENVTISYHSRFLTNSSLLFPEYSFYSIQQSILHLLVRMSTTSQVHSKLIFLFYI
jgi:hypothetical protein